MPNRRRTTPRPRRPRRTILARAIAAAALCAAGAGERGGRLVAVGAAEPPVTWCLGGCKKGGEKCVGNQNNPQAVGDDDCKPCQSGQTYWPCDVDGLCFCWNPDTPRIPPAPGSGLAQLSDEPPCGYFTEATFNLLAPEAQYPYTYQGFCMAVDTYNAGHAEKIFMMGTEKERKSELAAFLGHTLHESDEWRASREYLICADNQVVGGETYCTPCDSGGFNWETFKCDGVGLAGDGLTFNGYCNSVIAPPGACACDDTLTSEPAPLAGYLPASKIYFGRGAIQLSWNYNYRAASEALTGDPMTFCDDPDLVATTPEYAWGAGVFFWMENLKEETTCHIEALRNHDFGGTLNNINGGLECPAYHGGWHGEAIKLRLNRYCKSSWALGLDSILVLDGCKLLNNSYAECLGDGTCPDCQPYSDAVQTISVDSHADTAPPPPPATVANPVTPKPTSRPTPRPTSKAALPLSSPAPTPRPTSKPTPPPQLVWTTAKPTPPPVGACPGDLRELEGLPGCCVPEPAYWGDGACDPDAPYNTPSCSFDGGDCCRETCDPSSAYGCSASDESQALGPFGYFCVNPNLAEYVDPAACLVADRTRIGDGRCDAGVEAYNTAACNWDGGDCCEETCDQGYVHFECGDPEHPYDCRDPALDPITSGPTEAPTKRPTRSPTKGPTRGPTPSPVKAATKDPTASPTSASAKPTRRPSRGPTPRPTRRPILTPTLKPTIPGVYVLTPSDDATIVSSHADENYGSEKALQVDDDSGVLDALLRFDVSRIDTRRVASALLRLYCTNKSDSGGILGAAMSDWDENRVTWATAPVALGTPLHSLGPVETATWYEMDVTALFSGENEDAVSVRMTSNSWDRAGYSSKEGPEPPQLVLRIEDEGSQMNANMGVVCMADVYLCPDGSYVSRDTEDGCKFAPCQDRVNSDTGLFFPVWETSGAICTVGTAPEWASGAYLKESKSECCEAFFMLQMDECLQA